MRMKERGIPQSILLMYKFLISRRTMAGEPDTYSGQRLCPMRRWHCVSDIRDILLQTAADADRFDAVSEALCVEFMTRTPHKVAGPVAGEKRPDDIFLVNRCRGSNFSMPMTES